MKKIFFLLVLVLLLASCASKIDVSGELKMWHKVTLTFDGPQSTETAVPNPFTDYRLNVTFTQGEQSFVVPGYFAADGKAAYSSASKGNKWRVHFCPNTIGEWHYSVSFKAGNDIAISQGEGESAKYMDGDHGSFMVSASDKAGIDLRGQGRLEYVGEHYLKFAQSAKYFIKCGVDAPENLLAYYEIDNTPNVGNRLKKWEAHTNDYNADAVPYLWGAEQQKGKNILGAINYLAEKGLNAFSFLTFNVDGDDRNVYPYLLNVDIQEYQDSAQVKGNRRQWENHVIHDRFDVSKMDQWEHIFSYGEMKGMFLHFKTQENENDQKMDGGALGRERKLYYRELIARYAHHLALNWNLGEENTQTIKEVKEQAAYFAANDPYQSLVVVHTYPNQHEKYYQPLVDEDAGVKGFSVQTNKSNFKLVHSVTAKWVKASAEQGRKIVVAVDEPGDAGHALVPDQDNSAHDNARINALWGNLLAGGCGVEWYFGYKHAHSDLTCESWRSRDAFWDQCKVALDFFSDNRIPVSEMVGMDELTKADDDFVYAKEGEVYLILTPTGDDIEVELPDVGYNAMWLNPKTGEKKKIVEETDHEEVKMACPFENDALLYLYK